MNFLPIFLNIQGRRCLVVGGGDVATRKAALLHKAKAQVYLVAPRISSGLQAQVDAGLYSYRAGEFAAEDLAGCYLVIAATDDEAVNAEIARLADKSCILANVADDPDAGHFILPSVIDRSPIQIAVSSGGASPVLARLLRVRLETMIPAAYGHLAQLVERFRGAVKTKLGNGQKRRIFWENVLQGAIAERVLAGRMEEAEQALQSCIDTADQDKNYGEVYLVGGGPGDPDLLTFRALRLMQQADVVVYDRLVSPEVLNMTRRDAQRIYVGKERSNHAVPQEGINQLLARLAKAGKRVLRLKGGDPFIFGRGGEEIQTLTAEGIPFQVVPGITAASGTAAYAGIPLTHRDYAQSCVFVTGHLKDGSMDLNWKMLAQPQQTVVVYMGLLGLSVLCQQLIEHGRSADTPIALVQQATTKNQRVFTGTLATLPTQLRHQDVQPPSLIIVGEVVSLRTQLSWFEPQATSNL